MPVSIPTPVIGATIDGFIVRSELARGGMGAVWLAEHNRIRGHRKVIKTLLPEFAAHPDVRARFEREAAAASMLSHRRILRVDSFGELDGKLWLMMPFLEGITLRDYLRTRGPLSLHEALRVTTQLCAAVDHAHRRQVIHRDIKPSNIFLCPEEADPWAIQLLDFGIAKILQHDDAASTRTGHVIGTPHYMPVEGYEGSEHMTYSSDLYSAAIVIHEMVTGKRPWDVPDETASGVLYFLQKTQPPTLRVREWNEVLAKALAIDPTQRHSDARAFGLALAMQITGGVEVLRQVAPELSGNPSAPHRAAIVRSSDVTLNTRKSRDITLDSQIRDPSIISGEFTAKPSTTLRMSAAAVIVSAPETSMSLKLLALAVLVCILAATTTFTLVRHVGRPAIWASRPVPVPPDAGVALDAPYEPRRE